MKTTARSTPGNQRGGSAIGLVVTLAVIGYGVFVAIQFVPQHLEWVTVSDALDKVQESHRIRPLRNTQDVWSIVDKHLYINERGDLKEVFNVGPGSDGGLAVSARYQRSLNLLFTDYPITHAKTVELR